MKRNPIHKELIKDISQENLVYVDGSSMDEENRKEGAWLEIDCPVLGQEEWKIGYIWNKMWRKVSFAPKIRGYFHTHSYWFTSVSRAIESIEIDGIVQALNRTYLG